MDKKTVTIIILGIIITSFVAVMITDSFYKSGYNDGYVDGMAQVAIYQTQTGNIKFVANNTIMEQPISRICGVQDGG